MFTLMEYLLISFAVCMLVAFVIAFLFRDFCCVIDRAAYGVFAGFVSFLIVLLLNAANVDLWILDELFVTVTYSLVMKRWWADFVKQDRRE